MHRFVIALLVALVIAIVIRQMWFELYRIPTGSMRPTFKEGDFLLVSKTAFGLNIPLATEHFYFNQHLVERGGSIVFSTDNLDIPDSDMMYFYIFPGKKQYIKRLIAKPGDTIYSMEGKLWI
jgi:signal peptidase I